MTRLYSKGDRIVDAIDNDVFETAKRVLPGGTAALTDVGMTGPHDSVIGVRAELAIRRMRTGMPVRFETAQGGVRIEGALVECDSATGKASSIESVRVAVS